MSTKTTRKSLAFGAMFALVGSLIVATPAQANTYEVATLDADSGVTLNSIIGTGLRLESVIDDRFDAASGGDFEQGAYIINNPAGARLSISLGNETQGAGSEKFEGYATYDADGDVDSGAAYTDTSERTNVRGAVSYSSTRITTTATRIAIAAAVWSNTTARAQLRDITIDSEGTDIVTVTVQSVADTNQNGKVGSFEYRSPVRTVNLYPATGITATTTLSGMNQGTSAAVVRTTLSNEINAAQVTSSLSFQVLLGSVSQTLGASSFDTVVTAVSRSTLERTTTVNTAVPAGYYTAQVFYTSGRVNNGVAIQVGAASPVVDLSAGAVTGLTGVDATIIANKDLGQATAGDDTVFVRAGVNTANVTVQAVTNSTARLAANVQVRALVTATKLASGSTTTVSGSTASMAATGATLVATGRTDATGKVVFTFTNAGAKNLDKLTVVFQAKSSTGAWLTSGEDELTLEWQTAAYTDLVVTPAAYVAGENPAVTFTARDQFKQGVDSNTAGKFSVYAVAVLSGVTSASTYEALVATTSGKASFTFKNFAPANGQAVLRGQLIATKGTATTSVANTDVTVYNTLGTDKIAVADQFLTDITYSDYVTGDLSDPVVADRATKAGIAAGVTMNGSVLNVNGAGQPGLPVTISAPGVLFLDSVGEVNALNTITVFANEFGDFSVGVATQTVNNSGATVSISAGGKTATTLLKSYFPQNLSASNLNFTTNMRGFLVKNKTYRVTMKLTDKWGNPVATTGTVTPAFSATGLGSVQINNSNTAFAGNFAADGTATLFIRSPRNIAGPGQLSITLAAANYLGTQNSTAPALNVTNVTSDVVTTAWDERTFKSSTVTNVEIFDVRPTATITKPASGTTVVVTGARSAEVTVVRGKRSKTVLATSNTTRVVLKKGKGDVRVFVNGTRIAKR